MTAWICAICDWRTTYVGSKEYLLVADHARKHGKELNEIKEIFSVKRLP